jgi:bud site selection protein 31
MAWRLRAKLRKAPGGADAVADKLEEFEARMREATAAPRGDAMNAALTWPVHKLHYQKNRFLHDACYVYGTVSEALLKYLIKEKIADGALLAKWRKPGYDTVCSMAVLTRSNTNFGTVGICRTPLRDRTGQIMPNVQTGCVCCVSGCGGPVWWDDPVPEIVRQQILQVDPGKAHLFEGEKEAHEGDAADGTGVDAVEGHMDACGDNRDSIGASNAEASAGEAGAAIEAGGEDVDAKRTGDGSESERDTEEGDDVQGDEEPVVASEKNGGRDDSGEGGKALELERRRRNMDGNDNADGEEGGDRERAAKMARTDDI